MPSPASRRAPTLMGRYLRSTSGSRTLRKKGIPPYQLSPLPPPGSGNTRRARGLYSTVDGLGDTLRPRYFGLLTEKLPVLIPHTHVVKAIGGALLELAYTVSATVPWTIFPSAGSRSGTRGAASPGWRPGPKGICAGLGGSHLHSQVGRTLLAQPLGFVPVLFPSRTRDKTPGERLGTATRAQTVDLSRPHGPTAVSLSLRASYPRRAP